MKLEELLRIMDENTAVRITVDGTYVVAHYDGRDSIDDEYSDYTVNKVFTTTIGHYDYLTQTREEIPYISIDVSSPFYVEVWRTEDYEDWAKVNVDRETGHITDIQCDWDWSGDLTREEAEAFLAEDGFAFRDPDDVFESYEEWNDYVSAGGVYEYV